MNYLIRNEWKSGPGPCDLYQNLQTLSSGISKNTYEKEYFGFEEFAANYVDSLTQTMETTIHLKMKYKAPPYFSRYGKGLWYVSYQKRKYPTWYFFFTLHAKDIYNQTYN